MSRVVEYASTLDRLLYFVKEASPDYWDTYWAKVGPPSKLDSNHDIYNVTRQYLAKGALVIEGGCGRGDKVHALDESGYNAVGVDFAERTVHKAREYYPGCDIRIGDLRNLDLGDELFDGYWSIGIIEHFWNGYDDILSEAHRILKPGGYLFLIAPWISPYRRYKIRNGGYPLFSENSSSAPEDFYQFALSKEEVISSLLKHGFDPVKWSGRGADISMLEDVTEFPKFMQWLFSSRGNIFKRVFRRILIGSLSNICGHTFLSISRRRISDV